MTAAEWLSCDDAEPMLDFLRGKVSERKLRLYILACCQQLWGNSLDEATVVALQALECLVGTFQATRKAFIRVKGGQAVLDCGASDPLGPLLVTRKDGTLKQVSPTAINGALRNLLEQFACNNIASYRGDMLVRPLVQAGLSSAWQADLLRDIVRAPFHPLHFRASWRTQLDGVSVRVGQTIYDEQAFDQLPVLADALMDAGCDCDEILDHLRGPGPHVRGCWVLDCLLAKG